MQGDHQRREAYQGGSPSQGGLQAGSHSGHHRSLCRRPSLTWVGGNDNSRSTSSRPGLARVHCPRSISLCQICLKKGWPGSSCPRSCTVYKMPLFGSEEEDCFNNQLATTSVSNFPWLHVVGICFNVKENPRLCSVGLESQWFCYASWAQ